MKSFEQETVKVQLNDEQKALKDLESAYKKAKKECQEKIRNLNARKKMNDPNLQTVIHQQKYQKELLKEIDGVMNDLQTNSYQSVNEFFQGSYVNGYVGSMYEFEKQGIPITTPVDPKKVVTAIQTKSKLSQSYYMKQGLTVQNIRTLKKQIALECTRGIASGKSWIEVADSLTVQRCFDVSRSDAMRIVRTEGNRINQQGRLDAGDEAIKQGCDLVKQWDATLDDRTRPDHQVADGQLREWDEDFLVGGEHMKAPSIGGSAKQVINCRCQLLKRPRWALDDEELKELQDRANYFGLDKTADFEEFKQKYLQIPANQTTTETYQQMEDRLKQMQDDLKKVKDDLWDADLNRSLGEYQERRIENLNKLYPDLDELTERQRYIYDKRIEKIKENFKSYDDLMSEINALKAKQTSLEQSIADLEKAIKNHPEYASKFNNPFGYKLIQGEHSIKDDLSFVNPNYRKGRLYQQNCGYCSVSLELRRRGLDVEAEGKDGLYLSEWTKMFKNADVKTVSAKRKNTMVKELQTEISAWGDGSRGGVFVVWDGRSWGHFFNVEVVDGKAVFIDGQDGKYDVEDYFQRVKPSSVRYVRWDNLEMTDRVKKAVKNRGD